uniref:PH domain-containing protein n=1 Tax=Sphenodon punctatus TaxID=8508 RepID=A0A8D0GLE3_SPHPU
MEGALLKWTNYLSGWQPRYFVLEGGILSYYDSQDDVAKGSKGSIKMAVCEIKGGGCGGGWGHETLDTLRATAPSPSFPLPVLPTAGQFS